MLALHVPSVSPNAYFFKYFAGYVSIYAGGGFGRLDGVGTSAKFWFPTGLALDSQGGLFVADTDNDAVRYVSSGGAEFGTLAK
jgi:hypothetical protein